MLYFLQDRIIFPAPSFSELDKHSKSYERVLIPTKDGEELYGLFHRAELSEPTIIIFHGNKNAAFSQQPIGEVFIKQGYGVLLAEYRGYPGSTGTPSEAGLVLDGLAAYDFVKQSGGTSIALFAHSLGTGVAIQLASKRNVQSLLLLSPFASLNAVASRKVPWLPVSKMLKHPFYSDQYIETINAPIMIIHGTDDIVIPIEHGRALAKAAKRPVPFIEIKGAGHNNLLKFGIMQQAIEFFNSNLNN